MHKVNHRECSVIRVEEKYLEEKQYVLGSMQFPLMPKHSGFLRKKMQEYTVGSFMFIIAYPVQNTGELYRKI